MTNLRNALFLSAFMIIAGTVFGQGRGQGAAPAPGSAAAAGAQRGPGTLPPATAATPARSRTEGVPQNPSATKAPEAGKGTPTKVGTEISEHPGATLKLQPLLPSGTTLDDASSGFKNLGQFAAALHVSDNLAIPFSELKTRMITDKSSLGDAIHALKPDLSKDQVSTQVKRAEAQAKEDTKKS